MHTLTQERMPSRPMVYAALLFGCLAVDTSLVLALVKAVQHLV